MKFQGEWREIVGVVGDIKFGRLSSDAEATLFAPSAQRENSGMTLLIRGERDPRLLLGALRQAVQSIEPNTVVLGSDLMTDLVKRSSRRWCCGESSRRH